MTWAAILTYSHSIPPWALYVAGEAGIVSMFAVGSSAVSKIGDGSIGPNAQVIGVDPSTHRVYFPLKNVDGRPVLRVMAPR